MRAWNRVDRMQDRIGRRQRELMRHFLDRLAQEIGREGVCSKCKGERLPRAIERLESELRTIGLGLLARIEAKYPSGPLDGLSLEELRRRRELAEEIRVPYEKRGEFIRLRNAAKALMTEGRASSNPSKDGAGG